MKVIFTCCWAPGRRPETDAPFLILRSDQLMQRTISHEELKRATARTRPRWRDLAGAGAAVVRSAEVELEDAESEDLALAAHWNA